MLESVNLTQLLQTWITLWLTLGIVRIVLIGILIGIGYWLVRRQRFIK